MSVYGDHGFSENFFAKRVSKGVHWHIFQGRSRPGRYGPRAVSQCGGSEFDLNGRYGMKVSFAQPETVVCSKCLKGADMSKVQQRPITLIEYTVVNDDK